jgi:hypothetical protein
VDETSVDFTDQGNSNSIPPRCTTKAIGFGESGMGRHALHNDEKIETEVSTSIDAKILFAGT